MSSGPVLLSLITAALKAGVLLGLAAGLAWTLKAAPARARHGLWAGALAGCLMLPVLSPWVPDWTIAALPVPELAAGRGATSPGAVEVAPGSHRARAIGSPPVSAAGRAAAPGPGLLRQLRAPCAPASLRPAGWWGSG